MDAAIKFWTKEHPTFGMRTYWSCLLCNEKGSDEPALKRSAEEMANAHYEQARLHFNHFRLERHDNDRRNELADVMDRELAIFAGRMSIQDCVAIGSQIGNEHYQLAMKERDEQISSLLNERNLLRRKLTGLVQESRGTLREPDWTVSDELQA